CVQGLVWRSVASAWLVGTALTLVAVPSQAVTIFSETFDGYSNFPDSDVGGTGNFGLPLISEGADSIWYAIRFASAETNCAPASSQDCDVSIQAIGSSTTAPLNLTPVGRFEDEAGLVFNISTLGLTSVTLDFDWRLFSATGTDNMRVGYYVGDIAPYASSSFLHALTGTYAWSNWTALSPAAGLTSSSFEHATYSLPSNQADVWVAFWLDNGEGDFGKVDNVVVTAVPEPASGLLLALGTAFLASRRRR
ncbi:MAG: PEP-CTERM sorting domain-containing protein, partial [Candidatus Rokuibacteriota bacterium]